MYSTQELWELARHGGVTLALIGLACLLTIFVGLDRALALWGLSDATRKLGEAVSRALFRGDVAEARLCCERSRTVFADVLLAGFSRHGKVSTEAVVSAVHRERQAVMLRLRSRLWILGTVGAVGPFVGLFGTVVGIMRAFKDMAAAPGGGFNVVAAGISEALVATAAGIGVAILAVVLFNAFNTRLAAASLEMRLAAEEVLELLAGKPAEPEPKAEPKPESKAGG